MSKSKAKPGTAAELAELFLAPREIKVRVGTETGEGKGRKFTYTEDVVNVSALPLEQLGGLVDTLAPLVDGATPEAGMLELASTHRATVYAAFAQATGWPADDVRRIHPADFLVAVQAIIDANADFFVRLLGPAVFETLGSKAPMPGNGAGAMPSTSSSAPDTRLPTVTHSLSSTPQ